MLTSDLVRARRSGGALRPRFLDPKARPRLLELARAFVATYASLVGESRETLEQALDAVVVSSRDRIVADGLRKLCEDRAEFDLPSGLDPEVVRRELFARSAKAHRALEGKARFERSPIVAEVAIALGATAEDVERAMFADLRHRQELVKFEPIEAEALLDRYDVSVVQALLLRATRVVVTFSGDDPRASRKLFRAARFHGLLHQVRRVEAKGKSRYEVTLDGPLSLFDAVQRYGLKLALFFPTVLEMPAFQLVAEVLHGPEREPLTMTIDESLGLGKLRADDEGRRPELDALVRAFRDLESDWDVSDCDVVVSLPGEVVCAPDLSFTNRKTGEEVLFELFGFWSRDAVFARVELVKKGFPGRILLAVGKHLRVSEAVLEEDDRGAVYVFKTTLSAKEVLARLDKKR